MLVTVSVSLRHLSIPEFAQHTPAFVDIYLQAMCYQPGIRHTRITAWQQLTHNSGFTAVCALKGTKAIGIAFGYMGRPHHWWHQQIHHELMRRERDTPNERALLSSYFEVAELHVHPNHQGEGIGRALIHALTRSIGAPYTMLSTPEVAKESNAAFGLYRSLGFQDLLRQFYFSGDDRPFAVLWAPLPLPEQPLPVATTSG